MLVNPLFRDDGMEIRTDFLILGSGIAGLSLAIKAASLGEVTVVTKKERSESNTNYAQGGIAAVQDPLDRFEYHINDTLACGAGLCDREVVRFVVEEGPERIGDLVRWGVNFTSSHEPGKVYDLGREGGHSHRRVLHAKDLTGREIERALNDQVERLPRIKVYENHIGIDLIMKSTVTGENQSGKDACLGAYVLDIEADCIHTFLARYTIIATGGTGKVYLFTSNPDIATGDGIAMAYRAGAKVANLEFTQFHPTCLYHPEAKSFLITEALRGEGGILKLKNHLPFMERYHPAGSLAPRDVVAQAIDNEMKRTGDEYVLLDISHRKRDFLISRFPNIYEKCMDFSIDITKEPIPVVPAAHYMCGGILVDQWGQTNIGNLLACGEAACTGLHGANRLASNSLLEAVVFAHRSFLKIKEGLTSAGAQEEIPVAPWNFRGASESNESVVVSHNWDELRRAMSNYVGIVRSDRRLERAKRRIEMISREIDEYYRDFLVTKDLIELRNIALVASLIVRSALGRKESRGLHYNLDYPSRDDANWLRDTILCKEGL